jgi:hypothetical protein
LLNPKKFKLSSSCRRRLGFSLVRVSYLSQLTLLLRTYPIGRKDAALQYHGPSRTVTEHHAMLGTHHYCKKLQFLNHLYLHCVNQTCDWGRENWMAWENDKCVTIPSAHIIIEVGFAAPLYQPTNGSLMSIVSRQGDSRRTTFLYI